MKCQALLFVKKKKNEINMLSAAVVISALSRVKMSSVEKLGEQSVKRHIIFQGS